MVAITLPFDDFTLYRMALRYARRMNRADAARAMVSDLEDMGVHKTPDGVRFTVTNVRKAMAGM